MKKSFAGFSLFIVHLISGQAHGEKLTNIDLSKHERTGDCWIAIEGTVYDISEYIPKHPAPPSTLTKYCGKDATKAWKTKDKGDKGTPHSRAAERLLKRFEI